MKIGIDARFLGSHTGFDRYLQGLLETLEANDGGHHYIIFVSKKGDTAYTPQNSNFKKIIIDYPWYGAKEQLLGFRFKHAKVDLMHIPHWNAPFWMPVPFVVTIHDLILWQKPNTAGTHLPQWLFYLKYFIFKQIFARAVRKSRVIMVPSVHTEKELGLAFSEFKNKIIVTGEAVADFSIFPDEPTILAAHQIQTPYLLYVGSAYPHKNLKRLLEAFQVVRATTTDLSLVLVGNQDSFYQDLKIWAKEKNYLSGVHFIDAVPDSALATFYRHAALLVYPSLSEGFGLPPLEALSVGTRSVVGNKGSIPEVMGERALYCDPENVPNIAAQIKAGLALGKIQSVGSESEDLFAKTVLAAYDKALKD